MVGVGLAERAEVLRIDGSLVGTIAPADTVQQDVILGVDVHGQVRARQTLGSRPMLRRSYNSTSRSCSSVRAKIGVFRLGVVGNDGPVRAGGIVRNCSNREIRNAN